jgi:predicted CopG family antitoxin
MAQKETKQIVISKKNYDSLRSLGTVTDSFDFVITRLLNGGVAKKENEL